MTRSNDNHTDATNPAVRWFEWDALAGSLRYFDKESRVLFYLGGNFTFMTLDELGAVGGRERSSDIGIYSNEIRDPSDVVLVKSFRGKVLAEGPYSDIKDQLQVAGAKPVANSYIAFHDRGRLAIGCWRFYGAAFMAWVEFYEANAPQVHEHAVAITGYTERTLGNRVFRLPTMELTEVSEPATEQALALNNEVQRYVAAYQRRPRSEQAALTVKCLKDNYPGSGPSVR